MTLVSILVADDDPAFREALCRALRSAGYAAHEASDGAVALRLLKLHAPDVVITDIFMPECDGIELIRALKETRPDLPVLAITAQPFVRTTDLAAMVRTLGADAVFTKPFAVDDLLREIARLTGGPAAETARA